MKKNDPLFLENYVNIQAFPLLDRQHGGYHSLVERVRAELDGDGCALLKGFLRPEWYGQIEREGAAAAPKAYYRSETVNAYNLPLDAELPDDHPAKITMSRENAFVARDMIPETDIVHRLYNSPLFGSFLADCFGYERLYQLEDPLAGLCLNVLKPKCGHPWHYDINEFTVSMLTKKASGGGVFRYSPGSRSPVNENLEQVRDILLGGEAPHPLVRELDLEVGDLQLFQGRYSLHQVSSVQGGEDRHTAIFAYTLEPGVIGGTARTKQLFGRVLPAHEAAERDRVRADQLLD